MMFVAGTNCERLVPTNSPGRKIGDKPLQPIASGDEDRLTQQIDEIRSGPQQRLDLTKLANGQPYVSQSDENGDQTVPVVSAPVRPYGRGKVNNRNIGAAREFL